MAEVGISELCYISAAGHEFDRAELDALLIKSRANNQKLGVTGMLIHHEGSFLQVLEGQEATVTALYDRIAQDPRHSQVLRLFRTPVGERSFGEWTMGYVDGSSGGFSRIPGFNDFFRDGLSRVGLRAGSETKARDLATQFRAGRWRQRILST
jgi:Sensors of blue-light using FAD